MTRNIQRNVSSTDPTRVLSLSQQTPVEFAGPEMIMELKNEVAAILRSNEDLNWLDKPIKLEDCKNAIKLVKQFQEHLTVPVAVKMPSAATSDEKGKIIEVKRAETGWEVRNRGIKPWAPHFTLHSGKVEIHNRDTHEYRVVELIELVPEGEKGYIYHKPDIE